MSVELTSIWMRMRPAVLALVLFSAACGEDPTPDRVFGPAIDNDPCEHVIFLNGGGGTYRRGDFSNSALNRTSADWFPRDREVTLPPSTLPVEEWEAALTCLEDAFAPFDVLVTDMDPGDQEHLEIVVSTLNLAAEIGCDEARLYGHCAPDNCLPNHWQIGFVRGEFPAADASTVCETARRLVGFFAGLDHSSDCADYMGFDELSCGEQDQSFRDAQAACDSDYGDPGTCRCTDETTQNSYQTLAEFFAPRC